MSYLKTLESHNSRLQQAFEKIGELGGIVNYTNVLEKAGYLEDTYITSGDEEYMSGVDLSGYIEVVGGDIIRLKNVDVSSTSTGYDNRIYCYRSNKTTISNILSITEDDTTHNAVFKDGKLIQFTILESDIKEYIGDSGFIRIGAKNIDANSIVTINEEIERQKYPTCTITITGRKDGIGSMTVVENNALTTIAIYEDGTYPNVLCGSTIHIPGIYISISTDNGKVIYGNTACIYQASLVPGSVDNLTLIPD